jgi:hypothetical protein
LYSGGICGFEGSDHGCCRRVELEAMFGGHLNLTVTKLKIPSRRLA